MKNISAFAALGNPASTNLEKPAFWSGLGNSAAGAFNHGMSKLDQGIDKAWTGAKNMAAIPVQAIGALGEAQGTLTGGGSVYDAVNAYTGAAGRSNAQESKANADLAQRTALSNQYGDEQAVRSAGGDLQMRGGLGNVAHAIQTPFQAVSALGEASQTMAQGGNLYDGVTAFTDAAGRSNAQEGRNNALISRGTQMAANPGATARPQMPSTLPGAAPAAPQLAAAPAGNSTPMPKPMAPSSTNFGMAPKAIAVGESPAASGQDRMAAFRRQHGSAFDPNSRVDREKMQKMGTAFQLLGLTKEAGGKGGMLAKGIGLDRLISKGLNWGGNKLVSTGANAGSKALDTTKKTLNIGRYGPSSDAERDALTAAMNVGKRRAGAGNAVLGAGKKLDDTPWMKNTINAAGVTAAAGGAYGLGRGQGREKGIGEGLVNGVDLGVRHASQSDPGILGRLGQVFTGTPQADPQALEGWLSQNKDKLIQQILGSK